jgi:type III secretion protein J
MMARWLFAILLCCGLGCSAAIHHGLDEASANEVVAALDRAGIAAGKSRDDSGAFTVTVGQADAVGAIDLLRTLGLPRDRRLGFGDVYKTASLIPSQTEERGRYVEALAGELARTLESFDGVALARVHLVLPEADPLALDGKPKVAGQAAVLLKLKPGRASVALADVQKLVAGSVPGLDAAAVAVVFTQAAAPAREAGMVSVGPWRMAASSRGSFVACVSGLLVLVAVLAGLLLLLARRLAAVQRKG